MGRSGTLHAWQQEGVVPDIQTIGKGLGGGYAPVAAFMINHRVADTLESGTGYKSTISFFLPYFFFSFVVVSVCFDLKEKKQMTCSRAD